MASPLSPVLTQPPPSFVPCSSLVSLLFWFHFLGTMEKGLVTTTQVTHASPAGVYAHTVNRNWESNQQLMDDGGDPKYCSDIAKQLIHSGVGKKLKVSFLGLCVGGEGVGVVSRRTPLCLKRNPCTSIQMGHP